MPEQTPEPKPQTPKEEAVRKTGTPASEKMISKEQIDTLLKKAPTGKVSKEGAEGAPLELEDLQEGGQEQHVNPIDMIMDVSLNVRIELGRSKMTVEDILSLRTGSVVTLDKLAGDFVDVLVNDRLVARGEVLILNDNFCVRIAEIISPEERIGQAH